MCYVTTKQFASPGSIFLICFSGMPLTSSELEWHLYRHGYLEGNGYGGMIRYVKVYVDRTKGEDENGDVQEQNYRMYPFHEGTGIVLKVWGTLRGMKR